MDIWNTRLSYSRFKSALDENLARAGVGLCGEALNFLDFFVSFLCQDKNESPSDRTKSIFETLC